MTNAVWTSSGWRTWEWAGFGWRIFRVETSPEVPDQPRLRNPWDNSGLLFRWEPGQLQTAECFWDKGVRVPIVPSPSRCRGYVSESCTCGIRSMATLRDLAVFMASDRQLLRYPLKAAAVGRVRFGGKVQHRNPGLRPPHGYHRSEFAELTGPLYVSPWGARHLSALARDYRGVEVVAPDLPHTTNAQEWLEALAGYAAPLTTSPRAGRPLERDATSGALDSTTVLGY